MSEMGRLRSRKANRDGCLLIKSHIGSAGPCRRFEDGDKAFDFVIQGKNQISLPVKMPKRYSKEGVKEYVPPDMVR